MRGVHRPSARRHTMQSPTPTITSPVTRKGMATGLAIIAAAGAGVGLAVVTSNDDASSPAVHPRVIPAARALPQGNEGKLGQSVTPAVSRLPQGNEGRLAVSPASSSPIDDRFHRFQH